MTELESKKLIEELSFQNSELIKQNTALQVSKHKVETESEKLNLLYDLTSLGYLVLDINEKIVQVNDNVPKLLEQTISELINTNFSLYIVKDYISNFNVFLKKAKETKIKQTCKVELITNKKEHCFVYLNGLYIEKEKHFILTIKNITKKQNFKNELKSTIFYSNKILKLAVLGSFKTNLTTDIWDSSDMVKNIFGVKSDFCFNFDSWISSIHPDDKNIVESYFSQKIKDRSNWNKEYRIIRISDGKVRWIRSKGEFSFNSKNEIILSGIIQDITSIKQAANKIKIDELKSNSIFKSSKEGILILNAVNGEITNANPSLIEMIGYEYKELVGKELWEIGVFKNIATSKESFIELQNKEYIRFDDMPLETKAGKSVDVEFVSDAYMVGQEKVIVCHIRDISDRKKTEDALEVSRQFYFAMFEKNQAVQLLINPINGRIVDANSAAANFYGYSLEQFKSMNLSDISTFPPEDIVKELGKFGLAGQSYFQFTHKLASGKIRNIEIYTSLLSINGEPFLISTINDITKRKIEERKLFQLNKQLKEVNILKSQFISTVSHEFRTPLAGISSSIQLLRIYNDKWDEQKKDKMYKQIFDAVHHATALLDDISLIDEAQNSKFFKPLDVNLIPLINAIIEENLAVSGTNHTIIFLNHTAIKTFFMDAVMIRHIFNNIISNAIKYSPESKKITIDVHQINHDKIQFDIEDQGIGIPAKDIQYLLEPFYRASNIGEIKGTGFGLSIVKRFVELHKGELTIKSELLKGTKVTIILPLLKEEI
jgi:PAS domain S-box-containing protein